MGTIRKAIVAAIAAGATAAVPGITAHQNWRAVLVEAVGAALLAGLGTWWVPNDPPEVPERPVSASMRSDLP